MKIACLQFNPIQENTYVVWDDTLEAVVIDAGNSNPREDAALDNFIAEHGLRPVLAANTHGHFDHTLGVAHLKKRYGIPFAMSLKDAFLLDNASTSGSIFGVPVGGTHAHSWVMSFPDELSAFRAYAEVFPKNCLLLVDTYDTLASGVPNAITVFGELRAKGYEPMGIRLDSGDLAFLSRQARKMLDEAGFPNAKIFASGDLDEEVIWDLKAQGAAINVWGVGTRMITSMDNPALGGVYKLSAEEVNGKFEPRIKISENPAKITNPGVKRLYRFYDRLSGKALADLIALEDEDYSSGEPLEIFDPENTWKKMTLCDYEVRPLLAPIFENGEMVYTLPTLSEISEYAKREMETFWDEYKRLHSPHRYKVDLSKPLYELKRGMLEERRSKA